MTPRPTPCPPRLMPTPEQLAEVHPALREGLLVIPKDITPEEMDYIFGNRWRVAGAQIVRELKAKAEAKQQK